MKLCLEGKPISVNQLYRGRRFLTEIGKATKRAYFLQAKKQYRGALLAGDIKVEMHVYFISKASCDLDNVCKAVLDSLTGLLWNDDRQIVELHAFKLQDKKNPRIELNVSPFLSNSLTL